MFGTRKEKNNHKNGGPVSERENLGMNLFNWYEEGKGGGGWKLPLNWKVKRGTGPFAWCKEGKEGKKALNNSSMGVEYSRKRRIKYTGTGKHILLREKKKKKKIHYVIKKETRTILKGTWIVTIQTFTYFRGKARASRR